MENANIEIDISQKFKDYEEILAAFRNIIGEENQALNDYDIEKIRSLYGIKEKTVVAYRNMVAFFIKHKDMLPKIEQKNRDRVKEMSVELERLLKQNEILLKSRIETSESVMNAIVGAAKMMNKFNSTSYGSEGNYTPTGNNANAMAINGTF